MSMTVGAIGAPGCVYRRCRNQLDDRRSALRVLHHSGGARRAQIGQHCSDCGTFRRRTRGGGRRLWGDGQEWMRAWEMQILGWGVCGGGYGARLMVARRWERGAGDGSSFRG